MRWLAVAAVLLTSVSSGSTSDGVHVVSVKAQIDLTTTKVAHIRGDIDRHTARQFVEEIESTKHIPGDRVIVINSDGGSVDEGKRMLAAITEEQASGTKVVCVVDGEAHSMAFNILSHCDVRLAVPQSKMLVHKIRIAGLPPFEPNTAERLRQIAHDMDLVDEPFRQANAKAMHLTLRQYDEYADRETMWTAEELFRMHYLDGLAAVL